MEPTVLVITSGPLHGVRVPLAAHTTLGRQSDCDGVLDDPTVSRRHAVIEQDGAGLLLRDLGSRNGTTVNGRPVAGTVPVHAGDQVSFGSVDARLEGGKPPPADVPWPDEPAARDWGGEPAGGGWSGEPAGGGRGGESAGRSRGGESAGGGWGGESAGRSPGGEAAGGSWGGEPAGGSGGADFRIGDQGAGQIHNVGRDQINYVRAERESFLADIAAGKTKGRWLVTFGFLCVIAGFVMFGYGVFAFLDFIPGAGPDTQPSDVPSPLGPDVIGGVPLGALGFGLAALGSFLLIAGIVLHVSAAAKLRRLQSTSHPRM